MVSLFKNYFLLVQDTGFYRYDRFKHSDNHIALLTQGGKNPVDLLKRKTATAHLNGEQYLRILRNTKEIIQIYLSVFFYDTLYLTGH